MIEFALLAPVLMLMTLGLVDAARAVFDYNVISNSAREGAREAVLAYNQCKNDDPTACLLIPPAQASLVGVDAAVQRAGAGIVGFTFKTDGVGLNSVAPPCTPAANRGCVWIFIVNGTTVVPASCTPPNPSSSPGGTDFWNNCDFNATKQAGGHDVVVEVEFNFAPLTPLVGNAMGTSTIMWAKSEMKTEY
jgi:hypothetical protein